MFDVPIQEMIEDPDRAVARLVAMSADPEQLEKTKARMAQILEKAAPVYKALEQRTAQSDPVLAVIFREIVQYACDAIARIGCEFSPEALQVIFGAAVSATDHKPEAWAAYTREHAPETVARIVVDLQGEKPQVSDA